MKKISKQDFFELDPMEVDAKYGECLTEDDKEQLENIFNNEDIDDQEYIEKFYDMVFNRLVELDLIS